MGCLPPAGLFSIGVRGIIAVGAAGFYQYADGLPDGGEIILVQLPDFV